ncbi:MAG TPA: PAS domain S-box protein [Methanospirillum sp.]|nr:PAS domain S-box protein [Methanospirillum sp.]
MTLNPADITVLAVDDDEEFRTIIFHYLDEPGFTVVPAGSALEALTILKSRKIDAIIADYNMPVMDGLELLKHLRSSHNSIPFILFTGQGCESIAIQALNDGADFYMVKGDDPGPQFLVLRKQLRETVAKQQADASLRISEANNRRMLSLLRATLDATEDGILVVDTHGRISDYNLRLIHLLNLPKDQVLPHTEEDIDTILYPQLEDESVTHLGKDKITDDDLEVTHDYLNFTDGRVIERHSRPQICEDRVVGRVWSYHDLTDRVRAERALKESRERFRILFDNSPISHQALNENGLLLEVNQTWLQMLGYTREEVIGHSFLEFCTAQSREFFNVFFNQIIDDGNAHSIEILLISKSSSIIITIVDGIVVRGHDGSFLQIQCALRDITTQRKTEEQLKWTESLLEEIVDLLPFGICVTDGENQAISYRNIRFLEIWGIVKSDYAGLEGIPLPGITKGEGVQIRTEYRPDEIDTCTYPEMGCFELTLPNHRVIRSYTRKFSADQNETRHLWAFEDITRFTEQEDEIRQYARRLEILIKMISISSRSGNISVLCERSLQAIIPLMNYDRGAIYLISEKGDTARLTAHIGLNAGLIQEFKEISLHPVVDSTTHKPVFIPDITALNSQLKQSHEVSSVTSVPIVAGDKTLGTITLYMSKKIDSEPKEQEILKGIGRELGSALIRIWDQEALRDARINLENLVNSISDMVLVIDADTGIILDVNEEVLRLLGYSREDLIGKPAENPISDSQKLIPARLLNNTDRTAEHTINTSKGQPVPVETRITPGTWNMKRAQYCVSRDITQSLISQNRIRKSEERLRAIFDSSPIGIEIYNADGLLIEINDAALEIFGLTKKDDAIGSSILSYPGIVPSGLDEIRKGKTITYEQIIDFEELTYQAKFSSYGKGRTEIRLIITPLIIRENNMHIGYLALVEDITAGREAARLLRESEAFNRGLITNLPDYIMIYDLKGTIIYTNASADAAMAADEGGLIGLSIFDFVIPEQRSFIERQVLLRLDGEKVSPYEMQIVRKDKTLVDVITQATRIPYQGNDAVLVVLTDITFRKDAEEELEKYTQALQMTVNALGSANKKLNLLSNVTRHDIINQVHIILNYLDLCESEPDVELIRLYISRISQAVGFIQSQIEFTRSYQDLGIHAPEWQSISAILNSLEVGEILVRTRVSGYEILADPLLPKVFENLLDNSLRHGGDLSTIYITTTIRDTGDLSIIWEDDGDGIAETEKELIFEKGHGKNTGFGLFLIREILALTGITIYERGSEGEGAVFEIIVPADQVRSAR